jgi:hypothetical protein
VSIYQGQDNGAPRWIQSSGQAQQERAVAGAQFNDGFGGGAEHQTCDRPFQLGQGSHGTMYALQIASRALSASIVGCQLIEQFGFHTPPARRQIGINRRQATRHGR